MSSDEDSIFAPDSDEFTELYALAEAWLASEKIESISNGQDGEILEGRFFAHVQEHHPATAKRVKSDSGIYEAVLIWWNDQKT